ncbi:MAG: hypothetical protein AAF149_15590 [Bacteroidota bacterium]
MECEENFTAIISFNYEQVKKKNPEKRHNWCSIRKEGKRDANRKLRRKTKQQVNKGDEILFELREVSDVWGFGKDGKFYDNDMSEKEMRK